MEKFLIYILLTPFVNFGGWESSFNYFETIAKARQTSSTVYYDEIVKRVPEYYIIDDLYEASKAYMQAEQYDEMFRLLSLLSDDYYFCLPYTDRLLAEDVFIPIHSDSRWKSLITQIENKAAIYHRKNEKFLIEKIQYIAVLDQESRKYLFSSENFESNAAFVHYLDSINLREIEPLILSEMFSPEIIGIDGMEDVCLILAHADSHNLTKFLPAVDAAAKARKVERKWVALMEDKLLKKSNLPQKYGTQLDEKGDVYHLEYTDSVDMYRAKVGLLPLDVHMDLLKNHR